jgi:hypothetical protein
VQVKTKVRVLTNVISLLVVMFFQQTCLAQVDPWERVKLIEQGKNVHVTLHSGKTVKGNMESWNTDGLCVRQGKKKVVPLAKSDVTQVLMPIGMSRGRRAGWGAAIGGGIGGAIGGAFCAGYACSPKETAGVMGGAAIWIGGIAAGIAALFPQHKEVIYSVKTATEPREVSSIVDNKIYKEK